MPAKNTPTRPSSPLFSDRLRGLFFTLFPHRLYGFLIYSLSHIKVSWIKNIQISLFVRLFKVDTHSAVHQHPKAYTDLNAFFTRPLLPDARPIPHDSSVLVSPTDSRIMQFGRLNQDQLIQAKGISYTLRELLKVSDDLCRPFEEGQFINLYLSPQDYHRVHTPIDCIIRQLTHIPGLAFPVSPWSSRSLNKLYCRNERAVFFMETPVGPVALVMIAALGVSSLETSWTGQLSPPRATEITNFVYAPPTTIPTFNQGDELGKFNLGSSVILIFGSSALEVLPNLYEGKAVLMGEPLARTVV